MKIIGEKINGAIPKVAEAIKNRDDAFIKELAAAQAAAGADYIDVCASVSPEQEPETLAWLLALVQSATDTPVCVDSPDPHVIVTMLEHIKKPGLINSVSMEGEKMDVIFPAIAKTEWDCVALLCDNDGIPQTAERRLEIADTIIEKALACGIGTNRLYIDPLVIALATDGGSMTKFMHCCRTLKERYPDVHLTSGLSNIGFGLPVRKSVNQAFLTLAMSAGMDSAIMDPLNKDMLAALLITDALLENDKHCRRYTTAYRKGRIGAQ